MMSKKQELVRLEELKNIKAVSFTVTCEEPETTAWTAMRDWAVKHIPDYEARRFFGFASEGHHPNGEESDFHTYTAQMLLYGNEGSFPTFMGAEVSDAPSGLFLTGDVILDEYQEDGSPDIGLSMKKSSQEIYNRMQDMGGYDLDFCGRTFLEEHLFPKEWFAADDLAAIPADFKFWLPIKKK